MSKMPFFLVLISVTKTAMSEILSPLKSDSKKAGFINGVMLYLVLSPLFLNVVENQAGRDF
jgi:hypothetical protein